MYVPGSNCWVALLVKERMVDTISLQSMGFVKYASIPTSKHLASSDDIACAVSATMGMCEPVPASNLLIAFVAS